MKNITAEILGNRLEFVTDGDVFSPGGIDRGTLAMLSKVTLNTGDKLLDLGCGYGAVGIAAAKIIGAENVIMCDISENAVKLAVKNAALNGLDGVKIIRSDGVKEIKDNDFTLILSNPPYHTDFSIAKEFIEYGWKKLVRGGKMFMVTKRREWYKNKLISVFGGVRIYEIDGYYVFEAEKRTLKKAAENNEKSPALSKKLLRRQKRVRRPQIPPS